MNSAVYRLASASGHFERRPVTAETEQTKSLKCPVFSVLVSDSATQYSMAPVAQCDLQLL